MRRPPRELKPSHQLRSDACFSSATSATSTLSGPSSSSRGQALRPGLCSAARGAGRRTDRAPGRASRRRARHHAGTARWRSRSADLRRRRYSNMTPAKRPGSTEDRSIVHSRSFLFGYVDALAPTASASRSDMQANSGSGLAFILRPPDPDRGLDRQGEAEDRAVRLVGCGRYRRPPCASTIARLSESPIPIPPSFVVKKDWNRRSRSAAWRPAPLSRIPTNTSDESRPGTDRKAGVTAPACPAHRLDCVHDEIEITCWT